MNSDILACSGCGTGINWPKDSSYGCMICGSETFYKRPPRVSGHVQERLRSLRQCKFLPIGCKFQGNQLEVEKHESSNSHAELMMKLLLTLQTKQSSNILMLARSFSEVMSLKNAISSSGQEMKNALGSMQESLDEQLKEIQRLERKLKLQEDAFDRKENEFEPDCAKGKVFRPPPVAVTTTPTMSFFCAASTSATQSLFSVGQTKIAPPAVSQFRTATATPTVTGATSFTKPVRTTGFPPADLLATTAAAGFQGTPVCQDQKQFNMPRATTTPRVNHTDRLIIRARRRK